jgi:alpha-mannosidase
MISNDNIQAAIKGKTASVQFENFLKTKENENPQRRLNNFMVLGPFVLETGGALETEYLYERHKVLDCDYLESSGGEAAVVPYLGLKCKNNYFGEEYLEWQQGVNKWDCLRFDTGDYSACDTALFATEQRNCVYYAATYIECTKAYDAIICYETSGSLMYLNGELIDNKPYGRVKGIIDYGNQVAVTFHKGKNLLMFKIRTGYICDTIDLSMSNCSIFPLVAKSGNLGLAYPMNTGVFVGSKEKPRQVFPAFVGAFGNSAEGKVELKCEGYAESFEVPAMQNGACTYIRLSLPGGAEERVVPAEITVAEKGSAKVKGQYAFKTIVYDGFDGAEHIFSDFHFDTTYHQEQRIYALGAIHIVKNMIDQLEENPGFKAIISEVDYVHPYFSIYPTQREKLKQMFQSGRAEADCFYNQPNEMTSSPEGLVRNLVYGQLYHRDVLGAITPIYSPGDVFGHPNQLSQICKKGGCTGIYWGKSILGLDCLFRHVSPDGTELIHSRGHTSRTDALRLGLKHCHQSSDIEHKVPAYPRDGESEWMKDTLTHAEFSVMSDFHKGVIADDSQNEEKTGRPLIERNSRDISLYHAGVSLTRMDFKQANRLGENLLITAEKFAAIACLYGAEYPEKALDKAWRQLLCGQHHDSITGTNNEISFVDLMIEYREAVELAADIVDRATKFIASGVQLSKKDFPVFVFNPHTWDRTEPCEVNLPLVKGASKYALIDSNGNEYPLQPSESEKHTNSLTRAVFIPKVPAMGYGVYYLKEIPAATAPPTATDRVIENSFYRVEVDPAQGGGIISIYDKKAKREVLKKGEDGPANRVVILKEIHDRMETQHEFYTTGQKMCSNDFPATVTGVKGNAFTKLVIKVKMGTVATIKQEITLFDGVKHIDLKTVVEDYQDNDDLFTITFPLDIKGARPVFDDRFAPAVRCESDKKLDFQTHQYAMFSRCQVYAANQWLDYGPTVTLLLNGKGSVNIGMTAIIRSDNDNLKNAGDKLLKALTKKAIPVTCYPDKTRQAHSTQLIHFNEDLMNTDTRFVLSTAGVKNEYEKKLLAACKPALQKSFNDKLAANGVALLYIVDSDNVLNKPIDTFLIKAKKITDLNAFIDDFTAKFETGRMTELKNIVAASPLTTADEYGTAIINTGNLACSIERGGLLNMMLFHTAEFYGNIGKTTGHNELIPEQKTHVFTYALYPHEGSYREAGVYRKALAFNDKLISFTGISPAQNRFLPESMSFVKSNPDFIVTAFKLKGYPLATMQGDYGDVFSRGLTIRGFEPNGVDGTAKLGFGFDVAGAECVNLLDEEATAVKFAKNALKTIVTPHSIETFTLIPVAPAEQIGTAVLGANKEDVEPTYVRSWEHDLGTMPMGYLAVAAVIGKKVKYIDDFSFEVEVSVANNRPDMPASGVLNLTLPKGWQAGSTKFKYQVEAGGYQLFPVIITKPSAEAKGMLRLNYEDDGQKFEDVFEVGCFNPEITIEISGSKIIATVSNNTTETLAGELSLATPVETWSLNGHNPFAFANISPRTQKVVVKPDTRTDYVFEIENLPFDMFPAFYAVAKLMMNGRIYFAYAHKKGERHNYWAHVFYNEIVQDGGSIKKMLEIN